MCICVQELKLFIEKIKPEKRFTKYSVLAALQYIMFQLSRNSTFLITRSNYYKMVAIKTI